MSEGPTTAGSINAKLTIDDAEFMAKLAAADAAARKLGSVDPSIRIDVDDNGAITKLAAVDAAADKLDGSTKRLTVSQKALNDTNGAGVQRWQLIAAAIVALIPLLAPLAGYAVGVAGALAGMGAAGGLAIYGIVKAMGSGTAAGGQFRSELNQLLAVLNSLGENSANAMLVSFEQAVHTINGALPALNSQIREFAQILGVAGNAVLNGVINALNILNPLFVQASKYVLDLAKGFQSWTQNGGLEKFASYAMDALPIVADALGSLAQAALHLVEAFAPVGTVILTGLTMLGDAINAIPLDVLMNVGVAAAAGFAAFKLWSILQPILSSVAAAIGAVGVATQLAEGPIGWVTAGVSALAAVLVASSAAQGQATQAATEYASALKADNDAIGANVRLAAAKQLQDSGALSAANTLGISTRLLTDAVLGNKTANDQVTAALKFHENALGKAAGSSGALTAAQDKQAAAIITVRDVMKDQSGQLQTQITASKQLNSAINGTNGNLITNKGLVQALTDAEGKAADATDALAKMLAGLGQVNLDAAQANIQFQQALADASAAIVQNGATLDLNTQKGRDNARALDTIASNGVALVASQAKANASTDQLTATMATARQGFIDTAIKMGDNAAEANALADQYGLIPTNVKTAVAVTGTDVARQKVNDLQEAINHLQGKTIFVNTITNTPANVRGAAVATGRTGGTAPGLAIGGSGGTVRGPGNAFTDTAGLYRLANGEEVVSNMFGQASRWRSALKLMNSGADPLRVASAVNRSAGVSQPQAAPVHVQITSNGVDLTQFIDVKVRQGTELVFNQAAMQMNSGLV